jgi:ABC-type uncharacterized transport system substrate-binding protein
MRRREFITLVGGAAATWPLFARAQQAERMRRIGVLMGFAENDSRSYAHMAAFRDGLQKLGWTESRNIRIDTRWAAFDAESRQRFAKELITLRPDLILSHSTPTTAELLLQTRTIPIIFATVTDPVGSGFVASLPRPGGTAQGDCATRQPGRDAVQPGNGYICRLFPEALQSRRTVLRSGGNRSPCSRHVRTRIRRCCTGTRAE